MSRSRKPTVRVSNSCGNHGGCPWCEGNRLHANSSAEQRASEDLADDAIEREYAWMWQDYTGRWCDKPSCRECYPKEHAAKTEPSLTAMRVSIAERLRAA